MPIAEGANPLVNVLRFGFTPVGTIVPGVIGTDWLHAPRFMFALSNQIIRFGYGHGNFLGLTGTDYRHENRLLLPLSPIIRFGQKPVAAGAMPPAGTDYRHSPRFMYALSNQVVRFGFTPLSGLSIIGTDYQHRPRVVFSLSSQVFRFGHETLGFIPGVAGTDYRHENRDLLALSNQYIRFGQKPQGSGSPPPLPGTDYRHENRILYLGVPMNMVRFGQKVQGSSGVPPPPPAVTQESEPFLATAGKLKSW